MPPKPFSDHSFEQFLNEQKLMGSKCTDCQAIYVPPRALCVQCRSSSMQWQPMRGTGKLVAFTCIAIGPPAMIRRGYDRDHPYCSGVIELEQGARVVARIEEVDARNPNSIRIGMPLEVDFLQEESGEHLKTVLAFKPLPMSK